VLLGDQGDVASRPSAPELLVLFFYRAGNSLDGDPVAAKLIGQDTPDGWVKA
jgi:hypothetical protein